MFYHTLVSDWNHGNAHFLRGVCRELTRRGHDVLVYEPRDNWSLQNLRQRHGEEPVRRFHEIYPSLRSEAYDPGSPDLDRMLDGVDLIIVHEWSDHDLVAAVGQWRSRNPDCRLLFHDTHHRSVSSPDDMARYDLRNYDGVLAFGRILRELYLENNWASRAWVWHEAADVELFKPMDDEPVEGDLVWVGNWGDDERKAELKEFLFDPVRKLGLKATVYGVRYPDEALEALREASIEYGGWLANFDVPKVFARHRLTVHVPRRYYAETLVGIPTIRPFEAMACGIPLISAPWRDDEHLFVPGEDYLVARDGSEMAEQIQAVLDDSQLAETLSERGRSAILARHTCAHRVDELLSVCRDIGLSTQPQTRGSNIP